MGLQEIDWNPGRSKLRNFGFVAAGVFGFVAWRLSDGTSQPLLAAGALGALAVVTAVLSALAPRGNRPLYLAMTLITYPIGWLVSYAVLGVIFFGIVTPIGLVLRLLGRDAMQRKFDRNARTYFVRTAPTRPRASYFRQY